MYSEIGQSGNVSDMGQFSQLIETLYASLWDDSGLETSLTHFCEYFGSVSATLMAVQKSPRHMRYGWTVGVPEEYKRWYIENDIVARDPAIDLFEAESENTQGFVAASNYLGGLALIDTVEDDFKPWLKAENIVDTAGLIIPATEDEHLILALQRNVSKGPFTGKELQQLNLLAPHIKQTVQLFIKFYRQQHDNTSLQAAINTLSQPTVVINELMQVRYSNSSAETLITTCDDVYIEDEKFMLADEETHHQFMYQAWELASKAHASPDIELNYNVVIPRPDKPPITITLAPMFSQEEEGSFKGVLLQIFDPETQTLPDATRIQSIFRISRTEAILCEYLVQGHTLKDVAKERNVSINTVREQMRKVFNKTGYNRQSELIAAILRAIP
jgi:DNA-binding CsgD family transcriptional regulator